MTKRDFISYASEQLGFKDSSYLYEPSLELDTYIKNKLGINRTDFVINFLYSGGLNGYLCFYRREKRSDDILTIRIHSIARYTFWRDDIQQYVSEIAVISNCAGLIEEFLISEDGRFWNKNNELKAENEERFFDYLVNVEYDFHINIEPRTYEILRHFDWYEGRNVDISGFNSEMKKRGLILSEQQLAFFSEFSGLEWYFVQSDYDLRFFTLEDVLEQGETEYIDRLYDGSILPGEMLIRIGYFEEGPLYLSADGRIFDVHFLPRGRTALEGINNLVNHIPKNYDYYY